VPLKRIKKTFLRRWLLRRHSAICGGSGFTSVDLHRVPGVDLGTRLWARADIRSDTGTGPGIVSTRGSAAHIRPGTLFVYTPHEGRRSNTPPTRTRRPAGSSSAPRLAGRRDACAHGAGIPFGDGEDQPIGPLLRHSDVRTVRAGKRARCGNGRSRNSPNHTKVALAGKDFEAEPASGIDQPHYGGSAEEFCGGAVGPRLDLIIEATPFGIRNGGFAEKPLTGLRRARKPGRIATGPSP